MPLVISSKQLLMHMVLLISVLNDSFMKCPCRRVWHSPFCQCQMRVSSVVDDFLFSSPIKLRDHVQA